MKYGNVLTQIIMFSLKKVDDLRARENESERKKEPQIPHLMVSINNNFGL